MIFVVCKQIASEARHLLKQSQKLKNDFNQVCFHSFNPSFTIGCGIQQPRSTGVTHIDSIGIFFIFFS